MRYQPQSHLQRKLRSLVQGRLLPTRRIRRVHCAASLAQPTAAAAAALAAAAAALAAALASSAATLAQPAAAAAALAPSAAAAFLAAPAALAALAAAKPINTALAMHERQHHLRMRRRRDWSYVHLHRVGRSALQDL